MVITRLLFFRDHSPMIPVLGLTNSTALGDILSKNEEISLMSGHLHREHGTARLIIIFIFVATDM
ncbi:hypothetical protein [Methanoregula boonei]|uniref:hypothetical protein n=1 Tax=Methanoregula boonei TaxID=358766 RepID=UPI00064F20B1|nr:hypothetical protein [Methanoregula boonei]